MEKFLKHLKNKILQKNNPSLKLSMNHVHAEGVFSLVIDGTEFGMLSRIFIADKKLKPFTVQYHTHRYPVILTVLKGDITHHQASIYSDVKEDRQVLTLPQFKYRSFLNGGNGLSFDKNVNVICRDYKMPIASSINLGVDDYHTMSCSKGSIWVVQECGFKVEESKVLGAPFTVEGLYHQPAMFQINDKCQQVLKQINLILESYNALNNYTETNVLDNK